MNWKLYILFITVVGIALFSRTTIGSLPVIVYVVAALVFAIPFYFMARRSEAPTTTETVMATLWLWLRRLLCSFMALGLAVVGIVLLLTFDLSKGIIAGVVMPITAVLMGLICAFIGWFGVPNHGRRLPDYIRSYKENKQRYKWKWCERSDTSVTK